MRNEGWDSWPQWRQHGDDDKYAFAWGIFDNKPETVKFGENPKANYKNWLGLGKDVESGEVAGISFSFTAPQKEGEYYIQGDLVQSGVTWFETKGEIPWRKKVIVQKTIPTSTPKPPTSTPKPPTSTPTKPACVQCPAGNPAQGTGNANCDGKVDLLDFALWLSGYRQALGGGVSQDLKAKVDFNCDGRIDLTDFSRWLGTYRIM